jgi:glycosyltransferase involved in cell wall biosynthesis
MKPFISIIIPCRNEELYIEECIESILSSTYGNSSLEILIVDGESTDNTKRIIQKYQIEYDNIMLLNNPKKIVPIAMNLAIKLAKGQYIIRLDAHSKIPIDYFDKLIDWSIKLNADNVGGICIVDTLNENNKTNAIKYVLSNKFGVGNSYFRIGVNEVKIVDTVPFGCYKKEVFSKYGLYNEKLIRNQDIELNKRIISNGGKIYLVPNILVTYFARETFKDLAFNNYRNGFWNILSIWFTKNIDTISIRHFIPLFFVCSLLFCIVISFFIHWFINILFSILFIYFVSMYIISKDNEKGITFFIKSKAFVILHISYGIGSLCGIFNVLFKIIRLF